jgi:hypothetical protein
MRGVVGALGHTLTTTRRFDGRGIKMATKKRSMVKQKSRKQLAAKRKPSKEKKSDKPDKIKSRWDPGLVHKEAPVKKKRT